MQKKKKKKSKNIEILQKQYPTASCPKILGKIPACSQINKRENLTKEKVQS